MSGSSHSQIPTRGHGNQKLMLNCLIDLEIKGESIGTSTTFFLQAAKILPDGGLGVVAPGPVMKHVIGHVFDDGIEDNAVAIWRTEADKC